MSSSESASDIIRSWFLNSPSNGFRRLGRARTIPSGLFWTNIIWIFTVFMSIFICTVVINHIAHPTKIHLSVRQYRDPDHFPAITFCNINPLRHDEFLRDIRKSRLPGGESSSNDSVGEAEFRRTFSAYIDRILADKVNPQAHPIVTWGFTLNDLLIKCVFNKRVCSKTLTLLFHPNYGNCYTFDNDIHVQKEEADYTRHDWSIDDNNGENNYKLFLELFLHQSMYNEYLDERAAFRIFMHRKHEVPILSQNSVFLRPNKFTKLTFSQRITKFSQHCRTELTNYMKQIFLSRQVRYTQALCYKLCEHRFIATRCNCIEPTLAVFYQYFNDMNNTGRSQTKNISLCSVGNKCGSTLSSFNPRKSCKECLPECETIHYSVQSSYAAYPNVKAYDKIFQRVQNHFRDDRKLGADLNSSDGPSAYRRPGLHNNIVAVEISASPYPTEVLTESPMYTWVDLISSIGGQAGLWIGVSLLIFVEILELLYLLINHCLFSI